MLKPPEKSVQIGETFTIDDSDRIITEEVKIIRKSAILRNTDVNGYYRNIFDNCDVNRDGFVSICELKEFIANNEEDEIPDHVINSVYTCFDKNKDNQLDFNEFLDLINHPSVAQTFKRIGSRYLKFVALSSIRTKSLKIRRTVTNTGLYEEEVRFKWYTFGMVLISAIQIMCFYIDMNTKTKPIGNALHFSTDLRNESWRYVTHIFIHSNEHHLYGNVLLQLLIGVPLEMVHSWRVPVIYVVGATGGCLLHSVVNNYSRLVGGSGGMYSFYTAHIAAVLMNWREMSHPVVHLVIFGTITGFDAIRNYYMVHGMDPMANQPSHTAHLGGAITGLFLGLSILRNLRVTKKERILWIISVTVLIVYFTVLVTLNIVEYCKK